MYSLMTKTLKLVGYMAVSCSISVGMDLPEEDVGAPGCPDIVEQLLYHQDQVVTYERYTYPNGETITCVDKTLKKSHRDYLLFASTFLFFVGLEYAFKSYINGWSGGSEI